jgi:hypothetical protein
VKRGVCVIALCHLFGHISAIGRIHKGKDKFMNDSEIAQKTSLICQIKNSNEFFTKTVISFLRQAIFKGIKMMTG